jgi:hypothetical protein
MSKLYKFEEGQMKKWILACVLLAVTAQAQTGYDLEVLRWNCEQPNSVGYARSYGTLKNTSGKTLETVRVTSEYFADTERKRLVGQTTSFITALKLEPEKESTFQTIAQVPKFASCWVQFETSDGSLKVKFPEYAGDPPPRLP